MFKRLRRGFFLELALLFILCFGFATPALANPEDKYGNLDDVMLTAVIIAPKGADASGDKFVFHFAGGGDVIGVSGTDANNQPIIKPTAGGVEQDATTIKVGDVMPQISDVELQDTALTELNDSNSLTNGEFCQAVVQIPLSSILSADLVAQFPHAGVYTYEVTEMTPIPDTDKAYVKASRAEYRLRIYVKNAKTGDVSQSGDTSLAVDGITVERVKTDDGANAEGKVNPTYPETDANGKIASTLSPQGVSLTPQANTLAGDDDGRNVPGFTFANEYTTCATLLAKKLYDGNFGDRTMYSTVELAVHSSAAATADKATTADQGLQGYVLTYEIQGGGNDLTVGNTVNNEHLKLNGVEDNNLANRYMAQFNDDGWCYIKAELKEGSSIQITGEFGPIDDQDHREIFSTSGLLQGEFYYVLEDSPHDYRPTGYVYEGTAAVDPRVDNDGMAVTVWDDDPQPITEDLRGSNVFANNNGELPPFALLVTGNTTGKATTIFVVNNLDDNKVSTTGILVDNLPYILMIGVPLVVFAGMFIAKRRGYAA